MSILSLALVLTAAVLHAAWNLLVKNSTNKYAFTWWTIIVGAIVFSPVLFRMSIPLQIWPYLLSSAIFETLYFITLSSAYDKADFSLVYPIARGAAPIFLLLWTIIFLQDRPGLKGLACIATVVVGLYMVGSSGFLFKENKRITLLPIGLAFLVSFLISLYSIVDATAVRQVDPLPYIVLVFLLTAVLLTPFMLKRYGVTVLKSGFAKDWKPILFAGVMSSSAYILTLLAYQRSRVSYVGAAREVSIVFGTFAGWLFLKEAFSTRRIIGAMIVFMGILAMALSK